MTNEEISQGQGNPSPASGDNPQGGQPPANAGNKAEEIEALKKAISEKEELLKKKETQLEQAGYNIEKLKSKIKEAGLDEMLEEEDKLNGEKVKNIVQEMVKPELEQIKNDFAIKLNEFGKTIHSKLNLGGGGDAGQKPPLEISKPEPALSEIDRKLIEHMKAKWDSQKGVYVTPSGRICDLNSTEGIASGAEIPPSV